MFEIKELHSQVYELLAQKVVSARKNVSNRVPRNPIVATLFPIADIHFDSKYCDKERLRADLDKAMARDASIIILGDLFDIMQGKNDKRGKKGDMDPKYLQNGYINAVCKDLAEFLQPYKNNILLITEGNHETSWRNHFESDPFDILKDKLQSDVTIFGTYTGFIRVKMLYVYTKDRTRKEDSIKTLTMYYTHGSGGGNAPVTRGVIQTNRRQVDIDADIFLSGHIHQPWYVPTGRKGLTRGGHLQTKTIRHISLATYKKEDPWSQKKGFSPAIHQATFITFSYDRSREIKVGVEIT